MNLLSKRDVFAENKLFATLDTTTRKVVFEQTPFLLSDTVGFIRKLPHHLIDAFKATLEESASADILIHVVDLSNPQMEKQVEVVDELIKQFNWGDKLVIRGGYARTHDYQFVNLVLNVASSFPFAGAISLPTQALAGGGTGIVNAYARLSVATLTGNPMLLTRTVVADDFRAPTASVLPCT